MTSFFLQNTGEKNLKKAPTLKFYFNCFCTILDLIDIYYMDIFHKSILFHWRSCRFRTT